VIRRLALIVVASCGDNTVVVDAPAPPDSRVIDAALGAPDLTLIGAQMVDTVVFTNDSFGVGSCEVLEQCVGGSGPRRLLRFDTVTANLGTGDLALGTPPADGVSDATFTWSPCHMHHHVLGYAIYELRDANGTVLTGHKQAFCLQDIQQVRPGAASHGFNCHNQGMSAGWADVYSRALPCQWLDVTTVPAGTYTLHVEVNPAAALPDADLTNNEVEFAVTI
jgi:hypothetical protein